MKILIIQFSFVSFKGDMCALTVVSFVNSNVEGVGKNQMCLVMRH
jgi:hypothetical protein